MEKTQCRSKLPLQRRGRQFIAEHERSYNGTTTSIAIEILFLRAPKQTH
jgi:hypothetical protein